jgi:hypothetical protein
MIKQNLQCLPHHTNKDLSQTWRRWKVVAAPPSFPRRRESSGANLDARQLHAGMTLAPYPCVTSVSAKNLPHVWRRWKVVTTPVIPAQAGIQRG